MNQPSVDKLVQAVLYEGYNLYPYRPSVKTRCRWTFGGLYPRAYCEAVGGTDAWSMQVECLLEAEPGAVLEVRLQFLHPLQRTVGRLPAPCAEVAGTLRVPSAGCSLPPDCDPPDSDPPYEPVDSLVLEGTRYEGWQEAVERRVAIGPLALAGLVDHAHVEPFSAPASHTREPLRGADHKIHALLVRDQQAVEGALEVSAERLGETLFRLTVRVFNRSPWEYAATRSRDEASLRALAAANVLAVVQGGKFLSLTDPPQGLHDAAAACRNQGAWPVLVGVPGEQDAILAAPIILSDYPQIAPESPGDLFDGTEIDELLTLRILTLTDEEKAQAGALDERTRRLMQRTEALARQQLAGLHGAVRSFRPADAAPPPAALDPFAEPLVIGSLQVDGVELRPGDPVRLRPGMGGDILDLALAGKTATIESIEQDFEGQLHVAVTLDDDPGRDLGQARLPGHRFFFKPDEVAPLDEPGARR